ncbi:5,6-dimethylbenzimidazole synthase [Hahella sp. CCB-MM4]|uniref:5,6-dimethylbenzimidazole synthase n=1 Tax=Hahella sp. (strain CCB-MM4) TaxID=1926491 RepID=UPI000B9B111D|nr:5,6-dimethylbenzimidazole synthase [Hahella sp. CCB-MM4]OZG72711.1 5,6-dimethylbenzimidazole synthase [Hahella sp. CCB-MM4]
MKIHSQTATQEVEFSEKDRESLYKTIFNRRDVRGQFLPDPIPHDKIARVLQAAHHAPSVGFMQPWNFVLVQSEAVRKRIHRAFMDANEEAARMFEEGKQSTYRSLKLEGILESPMNICVTCDRSRCGPVVLGRTHIKTVDLYSTVCAVQNLWLAARAEGLGVGWVSIIRQEALHDILNIPEDIVPIAYLCIGKVSHFNAAPDLQTAGWRERLPLEDLVYFDGWQQQERDQHQSLTDQIRAHSGWVDGHRLVDGW